MKKLEIPAKFLEGDWQPFVNQKFQYDAQTVQDLLECRVASVFETDQKPQIVILKPLTLEQLQKPAQQQILDCAKQGVSAIIVPLQLANNKLGAIALQCKNQKIVKKHYVAGSPEQTQLPEAVSAFFKLLHGVKLQPSEQPGKLKNPEDQGPMLVERLVRVAQTFLGLNQDKMQKPSASRQLQIKSACQQGYPHIYCQQFLEKGKTQKPKVSAKLGLFVQRRGSGEQSIIQTQAMQTKQPKPH